MQRFVLGLSISFAFLAISAHAGEIVHTASAGSLTAGGTATVALPAFDGNLGVLRQVFATVSLTISGTLAFENTNATPATIGGFGGESIRVQFGSDVAGMGVGPGVYAGYQAPLTNLAPYDGTTDYAGASGATFAFANQIGQFSGTSTSQHYDDYQLQPFAAGTPVPIQVGPVAQFGAVSSGGLVFVAVGVTAEVSVSLRYVYDPFPAQICGTRWTSGCPCDNHSTVGVDAGCRNSTSNSGRLLPAGSASLSNETLTLYGGGMTNSSALYFQGTNFRYEQVVYGDGLVCVTGSIRRLGTRANYMGSSQVPGPGGTPISVTGAITAPGTRYYQILYRDLGNFCTTSTFNTTSGMAIVWTL